MKRFIAFILVAVLVLAMVPLTHAEVAPYLECTKVETNGYELINGAIKVVINLKDLPTNIRFSSLQFDVVYDTTQLEFVPYSDVRSKLIEYNAMDEEDVISPLTNFDGEVYHYAVASAYGMKLGTGDLLTLNFKVKDGVEYNTECAISFDRLEITQTPAPGSPSSPIPIDTFYSKAGSIKVNPTVAFYNGTTLVGSVGYGSGATSVTPPPIPTVAAGYQGSWPTDYALPINGGTSVQLIVSLKTYKANYVNEAGTTIKSVDFTIESSVSDITSQAPAVPAKAGYTGVWETFTIGAGNITINPIYSPITYTATFVDEDNVTLDTVDFTVEDTVSEILAKAPAVPAKEGYNGAWETFTIGAGNITVHPVYSPIPYKANYVNEAGTVIKSVPFTVESSVSDITSQAPTVPAKAGYTGVWEAFTIGAGNITIHPVYSPITYTATYVNESGDTIKAIPFTVESSVSDITTDAPAVPAKAGYTGVWETFTIGAGDITIHPVYSTITYKATFVDEDNNTLDTVDFTVENTVNEILAQAPAVPEKDGFTGMWEAFTVIADNITVRPIYSSETYTATFVDENGNTLATVPFTVEQTAEWVLNQGPAVPNKVGYSGAWEQITIVAEDITVHPVYTPITYTAYYVNEAGTVIKSVPFTIESSVSDITSQAPAVPAKAGYTGVWETFTIGAGNITINPIYSTITYKANYVNEAGTTIKTVNFTVENTVLDITAEAPAVPEKDGYTGEWEAFTIVADNITINPVYEIITYKLRFVADGILVQEVEYTINSDMTGFVEPTVPEKEGFTGEWEEYAFDRSALIITVNAVYTEKPTVLWGDANKNGEVDSADASHILRWIVKIIKDADIDLIASDVSVDSQVTAADASKILRWIVKLEATLVPHN